MTGFQISSGDSQSVQYLYSGCTPNVLPVDTEHRKQVSQVNVVLCLDLVWFGHFLHHDVEG